MLLAFLDEFGHVGPFVSRASPRHNESPVFGLAGFIMPHHEVRPFATCMLKYKQYLLGNEIAASGKHPATWEKKGKDLINTKNVKTYPHVREVIRRILYEIYKRNGKIFFYGREKYQNAEHANANGLYRTVLSYAIRNLNRCVERQNLQFMLVLDQHSGRKQIIETSAKTMFDAARPARCLIEPPFEVESHLYQTVQAADWVATLIGRLFAFRYRHEEYADWEWAELYFGDLVDRLATDSVMWRPQSAQRRLPGV